MSALKPLVLYSHTTGPNPWKVAIVLEELQIPYETKFLEFPAMKAEPFVSINPNGRVPALEDPNTGVKVFEVSVFLSMLLESWDKEAKLHHTATSEKYLEKSWLHFQMSGQGPYWGQKAWFTYFHSEKNITSAIERYGNEIKRTLGVIDAHLKKTGKPYLVGDKISYADLAFIPWQSVLGWLLPDFDAAKEFPEWSKWNQRLLERPAVKKVHNDSPFLFF